MSARSAATISFRESSSTTTTITSYFILHRKREMIQCTPSGGVCWVQITWGTLRKIRTRGNIYGYCRPPYTHTHTHTHTHSNKQNKLSVCRKQRGPAGWREWVYANPLTRRGRGCVCVCVCVCVGGCCWVKAGESLNETGGGSVRHTGSLFYRVPSNVAQALTVLQRMNPADLQRHRQVSTPQPVA